MVRIEPHRASALTRAELIRIREGILQHFHHRDNARRLIFNTFDWRTGLTQVRQQKGDAAAAL